MRRAVICFNLEWAIRIKIGKRMVRAENQLRVTKKVIDQVRLEGKGLVKPVSAPVKCPHKEVHTIRIHYIEFAY